MVEFLQRFPDISIFQMVRVQRGRGEGELMLFTLQWLSGNNGSLVQWPVDLCYDLWRLYGLIFILWILYHRKYNSGNLSDSFFLILMKIPRLIYEH